MLVPILLMAAPQVKPGSSLKRTAPWQRRGTERAWNTSSRRNPPCLSAETFVRQNLCLRRRSNSCQPFVLQGQFDKVLMIETHARLALLPVFGRCSKRGASFSKSIRGCRVWIFRFAASWPSPAAISLTYELLGRCRRPGHRQTRLYLLTSGNSFTAPSPHAKHGLGHPGPQSLIRRSVRRAVFCAAPGNRGFRPSLKPG